MNRAILILLLLTASLLADSPWPGVEYSEVRAFAWKIPEDIADWHLELIRQDMTFADGLLNKEGAVLSPGQIERLLTARARRRVPRSMGMCYVPHNAFAFYNREKKVVAFLEVCFDCLKARINPNDANCDPDFVALANLCAELKLPFGRYKTVEELQNKFTEYLKPENLPTRK